MVPTMLRRVLIVIGALSVAAIIGYGVRTSRNERGVELRAASKPPHEPRPQPRAVVESEPFDLGVMNPGDTQKHKFRIRNEGNTDLTLELGSTTCKCTLAEFDKKSIPPGGTDFIELEWHAEDPQFKFRQGAVINSNDPALPQFELMGEGSIRVKLATQPDSVYLADVARNKSRTLSVLLFSQAYVDVEINKIESSLPAVRAEMAKEVPDVSPVQETRFRRDVVVTLEPQTKTGHHDGLLHIHYIGRLPDGTKEPGVYQIPLSFEVVGDVTLHGRDVVGKTLIFGPTSQSAGAKKQAYVHMRGENLDDVRLTFRRSNPEFLKVDVGGIERLSPTVARFPVSVEIPPGSPTATFLDDDLGEVELNTTRADTPSVRFQVSLIIAP